MKLSISNIAWTSKYDSEMYQFLQQNKFEGLEIAPTRIFPDNPYDRLEEAKEFAGMLKQKYNLEISSMQSIWYGRTENIFASDADRKSLLDYTKKAILFSEVIGCHNLVFGNPKNRNMPDRKFMDIAVSFFSEIGEYAKNHNTVIALEPNPPFYNTNFINTTSESFEFCKMIDNKGLRVNVDLGTSINYGEDMSFINKNIDLVNHIHISEPMLAVIKKRKLHKALNNLNYDRYISIEMKDCGDIDTVKGVVSYIREAIH